MLAKYYRFRVYNDTDQAITATNGADINCYIAPWKISSGALSYGSTTTDNFSDFASATLGDGGQVATGAELEGAVHDNTSDLYLGVKGTVEITADQNSTDGVVYLLLEESDDNSIWPSDQDDFDALEDMRCVAVLNFSSDAEDEDRATNFEF